MTNFKKIFENLAHEKLYSISPLEKGFSNTNYFVNDRYVLRIKSKYNNKFYDPKTEFQAMKDIKKLHLDIYCLSHDKEGNKITVFEPLAKAFNPKKYTYKQIEKIAEALRNLHRVNTNVTKCFDYFKRLKYYKLKSHVRLNKILDKEMIKLGHKYFDYTSFCLCHNDLVQGNILFIEQELRIIDYEYASLNDPFFDLASFLSENNITELKAVETFLKTYFYGYFKPYLLEKIKDYFKLLDYLWYYWAMMMARKTNLPVYYEIAEIKKDRLVNGFEFK